MSQLEIGLELPCFFRRKESSKEITTNTRTKKGGEFEKKITGQ